MSIEGDADDPLRGGSAEEAAVKLRDEPFPREDPFAQYADCYAPKDRAAEVETEEKSLPSASAAAAAPAAKSGEGETKGKKAGVAGAGQGGTESPPDVIEVEEAGGSLVRVKDDPLETKDRETQKPSASATATAAAKKAKPSRRQIRIGESPDALAAMDDGETTLKASKPTKYYKPPKASSRGTPSSSRPQSVVSSGESSSTYAGSSSPATFRGLLRGVQRLFSPGDDALGQYHKEKYSSTLLSPDFRTAKEQSRKADRRAGRTTDLYSPENKEEWRLQCRMRAEERDVDYVRDMKVVFRAKAKDNGGDPIITVVGAHYSKRMIPREDMLLHILKETDHKRLNNKAFSVLYFHANAELESKPKVGFFKSLHAALGGESFCERKIKQIFLVHPTPLLRTWIATFKLRIDPEVFKKVVFVKSLAELRTLLLSENVLADLPQHVLDHEAGLA